MTGVSKDSLQALKEMLSSAPAACPCYAEPFVQAVRNEWREVSLTNLSDEALSRYFSLQTSVLADIGISFERQRAAGEMINGLIRHLFTAHGLFADANKPAPGIYRADLTALILAGTAPLNPSEDRPVSAWLCGFLRGLDKTELTFGQLHYVRDLSFYIGQSDLSEAALTTHLISINFNHLELFHLLSTSFLTMSVDELCRELASTARLPVKLTGGYDNAWMPLKEMLTGWLREEIAYHQQTALPGQPLRKLFIDLPVAHLACLLRLLHERNLLGTGTLTGLFRQVCGHISTKRQPSVSEGSLSKEFYGVSQQTAARVRGTLEEMISLLDRKYFP